ncbi:MAG: hypothetical protein ABI567_04470 [Gammaproteobacteria bacterium]
MRVIPVWVRALAAVAGAAGVLAIVLLVRHAPDQVAGIPDIIGLGAQAILFLCMVVLFGYVAVTGLPPAHLWGPSGLAWWSAGTELTLTPELQRFLALLRQRHPGLRECWLLDTAVPGEWRLLAMADGPALDAVRGDWDVRRKNARLYLVDEPSRTVALAWGRSSPVAFATWDWEPQSDTLAEFRCPVAGQVRLAQRLWS